MKRRYRFHPGDYALGENEQFYTEMAARGWLLERRGAWLSRFRRGEPARLRYRVELSCPGVFDESSELPEEQRSLYEACGWRFVSRGGLVNVFCAPEGSGAPEFYSDPRQQADTLKALRRNYLLGWLPFMLLAALQLAVGAALFGGAGSALGRWAVSLRLAWVTETALVAAFALFLLRELTALLYGEVRTGLLYRRLRRGVPLDHAPGRRQRLYRAVRGALLAGCAAFACLAAVQWASGRPAPLPQTPRGPYLLLGDLGHRGERTTLPVKGGESTLSHTRSLQAEQWRTREFLREGEQSPWLYQQVYRLGSEREARALLPLLLAEAPLARDPSAFAAVQAPGFDEAYCAGAECAARRGNTVYFITYSGLMDHPEQGEALWQALAQREAAWREG